MTIKTVNQLNIFRTLTSGEKVEVGILAQNRRGTFFQYAQNYLTHFENVSPFQLRFNDQVQQAPASPHGGLHGVFADSLPDGWGLLLQDRVFRQQGLIPAQITAMDRLAFVGEAGLGALSFRPVSDFSQAHAEQVELFQLGRNAQLLFDGQTSEVLSALIAAGHSGGARPKAQVYFAPGNFRLCRTRPSPHASAWIVKFTSANLALGHDEGLCEAAYLTLAERAGLQPPEWRLLDAAPASGAKKWLALKRFDYLNHDDGSSGRLHCHSACGLLDADFRLPSLDYEDLIKATKIICRSPAAGQLQFKRALFNLLLCNQDDHSKNWSFLQDDFGVWRPAPFYDVTFSLSPYGEHATAYSGHGKYPPKKALQRLADVAGYTRWSTAVQEIKELIDVAHQFAEVAKELDIDDEVRAFIVNQITQMTQYVSAQLT